MTENEKIQMRISQCKICLLAEKMKVCPLCNFNVGLVVKFQQSENKTQEIK